MKKSSILVGLAGIAAFVLPISLVAEHHEEAEVPPPLSDVWIVVPKAGMGEKFAEAATAHMKFRTKAGESRSWQVYNVAVGHKIDQVQFRSCCFNWADMDTYLVEGAEKGLDDNWNENVDQYVDHYHHYLERMDWENSHWPESEGNGPYYGVTSWVMKEGAGPGPGEAREEISQAAKNGSWAEGRNWLWFERMAGEPILAVVTSFKDFASMAPKEPEIFAYMAETVGAEKAGELFAQFGSGMASSDYTVWVLNPDMSSPAEEE